MVLTVPYKQSYLPLQLSSACDLTNYYEQSAFYVRNVWNYETTYLFYLSSRVYNFKIIVLFILTMRSTKHRHKIKSLLNCYQFVMLETGYVNHNPFCLVASFDTLMDGWSTHPRIGLLAFLVSSAYKAEGHGFKSREVYKRFTARVWTIVS